MESEELSSAISAYTQLELLGSTEAAHPHRTLNPRSRSNVEDSSPVEPRAAQLCISPTQPNPWQNQRAGADVLQARSHRAYVDPIANENLAILDAGGYELNGQWVDIAAQQRASIAGTTYHGSRCNPSSGKVSPNVRFEVAGSMEVAEVAYRAGHRVCVLNFASARNPGGGFLTGARAQEEDLCRASGLYPTLLQHQAFYNNPPKGFYTDRMIYSPQVPVFRNHSGLMSNPFYTDIVTAAAVNMTQVPRDERHLVQPAMLQRMAKLLTLCKQKGADTVVLGAWGTGVFGLDVQDVAWWFRQALASASIPNVVFAIPDEFKCANRR